MPRGVRAQPMEDDRVRLWAGAEAFLELKRFAHIRYFCFTFYHPHAGDARWELALHVREAQGFGA